MKTLRSMVGKDKIQLPDGAGGWSEEIVDKDLLKYYLDPAELFARSYAQHIATQAAKAGHLEIAGELQKMLDHYKDELYPAQWGHDDFEPIANAIDDLLRTRGLKK